MKIVYFFGIVICWFSQNLSAAEVLPSSDSQAQAIERFPEIGVAGSVANKRFLSAVEEARKSRPDIFKSADWPLIIAFESESLNSLSKALQSGRLNLIEGEAIEFRCINKGIEKTINELGVKLKGNREKIVNHEKNLQNISLAVNKLRKNAETCDAYVPFNSGDRSHLVKAESYRKQAEEILKNFNETRIRLQEEELHLTDAVAHNVSAALELESASQGLASARKGGRRKSLDSETETDLSPRVSKQYSRATIIGLVMGKRGNRELDELFRNDLIEWRLIRKYNTSSTESSWFESLEEDLKKRKPEALFTQAVYRMYQYLPEKNRGIRLDGKSYFELSLEQFSQVHDEFALAIFLEGLSKICFTTNSLSKESQSGISLLEEASRCGIHWAKLELENIIRLPEFERKNYALGLLGNILSSCVVDWASIR